MKRRKLVVLSVVGGLLLAVFGVVPASASPDTNPGRVLKVAVIGDSYTAGNGAGIYENDNADGSYHSLNNWGHVYVDWLKEQGVNAQLVEVLAYGGSVTDDLLCAQDGTYRSTYNHDKKRCEPTEKEREDSNPGNQIARIPDDTDIVLLTIGGNDVYFSKIVKQCFAAGMRDPETCKDQVSKANDNLRKPIDYKDDDLGKQVSVKQKTEAVLEALDARLKPSAEVVLVGYPRLATDRPYVLTRNETYADGHRVYNKEPYKYPAGARVRELGMEATRLQQEIVDEWNAQGGDHVKVTYVGSIADVFAGHEPDPSAVNRNNKRWINEFFETRTREVSGRVLSAVDFDQNNFYHPGITGHEMIAREIARVVGVSEAVRSVSRGSVSQESVDVAVVVDSTGSMSYVNENLGSMLEQTMNRVTSNVLSARFGVVSYRDYPGYSDIYDSRVDTDFTTNTHTIKDSFVGISGIEHHKDHAQSTVFSGVGQALSLNWRKDAHKVMIVIGDAGAREVEKHTGYTAEQMTQLAGEAGGVEVYAIDTQNMTTSYGPPLSESTITSLVETTGGQIYTASTLYDISTLIDTAIDDSLSKPSAWLEPTGGYTGEEIVFDARGSYSTNGQITQYEWDTNNDGIYEQTTTTGTLTRVFDSPLDTTARVRVTDETGHTSIATAPVLVTVEPESLPEADTSTLQDKPGVSEVLDEQAIALFPELAPVAKDATLPDTGTEPNNSTPTHTPTTTHLPNTGTQTGVLVGLGILLIVIGFVVVVVVRKQSQR